MPAGTIRASAAVDDGEVVEVLNHLGGVACDEDVEEGDGATRLFRRYSLTSLPFGYESPICAKTISPIVYSASPRVAAAREAG